MDDVQPFALGRGEAQAPVMLSGLDRLGERLGRRVREIVEPFVGVKPVVTARPVELIDYGAWAVQVQPLAAIGLYRLMPLKGQVMLHLSAAMISTFVERFYGGAGGRPSPARSEFTPTEERLIARISDAVMAALAVSWSDMLAVEPVLASREAGLGFASGLQASDQMALQRFTVAISASEQWPVDILLPVSALRSIEPLMDTSVKEEKAEPDPVWQARVARQMAHVRLPARTVLARPNLTLAELMALQPGDVIPVHISRSLPLIVGDRIFAHGTIGEQDGRAAFMIEKLQDQSR